jgi:hypothetical protein
VRRLFTTLVAVGGTLLGGASLRAMQPAPGGVSAVLVVQDRSGDEGAVAAVELAVRDVLREHGELVDAGSTRDVLRGLRVRNGDQASRELLRRVGEDLGADWMLSVTVHHAERQDVPRLSLSARAYRGSTGEMFWAGLRAATGADRRRVLGLGEITELELLAPRAVRDLLTDLLEPSTPGRERKGPSGALLGRTAIVPFDAVVEFEGTTAAETVTEVARSVVHHLGADLVSPGCVTEVMRRQRVSRWGGVDAPTREGLRDSCGADSILTGLVERYDVGEYLLEPDPDLAVAVRLIDAETGRILWMGGRERKGVDYQSLFQLGRIRSRGALAERMLEHLMDRLLRDRQAEERG